MIAIIDYDAGNLLSVKKALEHLGYESKITRNRDEILCADKVILPGVGAFEDAMGKLKRYQLINTLYDVVDKGVPLMGICLGLQLLFESSEEGKGCMGLGLLKGKIVRIPDTEGLKIPHMGWNSLDIKPDTRLFAGIDGHPYVYFVHSYYLQAEDEAVVAAATEYGAHIHAAVEYENLFACQFHPEKSSEIGLKILDNFASL